MEKRFVSIWFRYLKTDWFSITRPELRQSPFVLKTASHGRIIVSAVNAEAEKQGIFAGMVLADARAIVPSLKVWDDQPDLPPKLLKKLAAWCIRFTPTVALDLPDGLIFDASGCSHLWGGDEKYIKAVAEKLNNRGYHVHIAMADTIGAAWGVAHYCRQDIVIHIGENRKALMALPPEAFRLEPEVVERLHKLGLHEARLFLKIDRSSLRRRFGTHTLLRIDQALDQAMEIIDPVVPPEPYQERLPCLEPMLTAAGIGMALQQLLEQLCFRLKAEQMGLRKVRLHCYRVDGEIKSIEAGTSRPTHHVKHVFRLLEDKIATIDPGLGIELFVLEAPKVEAHIAKQEKIWEGNGGLEDERLSELIDRLANRIGSHHIHRYLPVEHYWPERSFKEVKNLVEVAEVPWQTEKARPLKLLANPEKVEVTAPIPDYPPMLFRYKGKLHHIVKADGPERIEQEWWIQQGEHRDYYRVEDEHGNRYWLFRLGHYHEKIYQWFIHGFFA